ncbi:MAG TPA: TetR/AcrR family transcriptional regulator [Actinomycetota bacterium]|nr:TetR/AcrR family transcriptional regulator [Actinomycetota bacterium]
MALPHLKRVTKRPDQRRAELINAAIEVFAEKGLDDATVADITTAAGVAKGTFYLYFSSKEHLLAALRERFVEDALEHAATLFERVGTEDWWGLVDATVESSIDFALEHRDSIRIFGREGLTAKTREIMGQAERKLNAMFSAGIQAGIAAGAFQVSDPELTAIYLHHAIDGTVFEAILFDQDLDRDRLVAGGKELAHKVLSPGR